METETAYYSPLLVEELWNQFLPPLRQGELKRFCRCLFDAANGKLFKKKVIKLGLD